MKALRSCVRDWNACLPDGQGKPGPRWLVGGLAQSEKDLECKARPSRGWHLGSAWLFEAPAFDPLRLIFSVKGQPQGPRPNLPKILEITTKTWKILNMPGFDKSIFC